LNTPVPPPPPNVPQIDEKTVGKSASLRQQMEAHRTNAVCASCHSRMDPLGFGMENFNAVGAWRTVDGTFPIDSSGTLPNGSSFKGPAELETMIEARPQVFAEAMTSKMLIYAIGRGLEPYDKSTVKTICQQLAENKYKFSALVLGIVNSMPFQMRGGD
jgi:cytochrome c556